MFDPERKWVLLFGFAFFVLPIVPAVVRADTSAICLIGDHPGIPDSDAQTAALLVCDELHKQGISVTDPVYEAPASANGYRVVLRRLGEKIIVHLSHEKPIGTIIAEQQLTLANIEEMIPAVPKLVDPIVRKKSIAVFDITGSDLAKVATIDAEQDAKNDVNASDWFVTGYLGGAVMGLSTVLAYHEEALLRGLGYGGMIVGYLPSGVAVFHAPSPPTERLLGKSPEYVNSYTETYTKKVRQRRGRAAGAGCTIGFLIGFWGTVAVFLD